MYGPVHDTDVPIFPFIVGCPRSGTTLLRALLDSHPDVFVAHEASFVVALGLERQRYESPAEFDVERLIADLLGHRSVARLDLLHDGLIVRLRESPPRNYADAVRRIFADKATRAGKQRYADKTPLNLKHIDMLASLFPEARFVHVIRDGRDVATSLLDVRFGPADIGSAALYWRSHVRSARKAVAKLGPGRYLEVFYEELVSFPEEVLRKVCDFVGVGFDPHMLRYPERATELLVGVSNPQQHRSLMTLPMRELRDWRRELSSVEISVFEKLAGRLLVDLGYPLGAARLSSSERLASARRATRARMARGIEVVRRALARFS